jgi:CHASE2 domain-containing sensor protein
MVGEFGNKHDLHETVLGEVPGVVLQANYVESQLDDRYLKPVGKWRALTVNLLWVALIEVCFVRWTSPQRALFFSVLSVVFLWLMCYIIVFGGYFLPIWQQNIWFLLITLRWLEAWREKHRERLRHHQLQPDTGSK